MLFNSVQFVLFFPVVTAGFFIFPKKFKNIWLLLAGYYFYVCASPAFLPVLIGATLVTWAVCLVMHGRKGKGRTAILCLGITANIGALFFFKYFAFACSIIGVSPPFRLLLPVGISFYLFQATGYLIDVYRGSLAPEKRLLRLALFLSFFPCLLSGPITRAGEMLPQFEEEHRFDYERIRYGLLRMLFGYFMKLVIVARLDLVTTRIFDHYGDVNGYGLALGMVLYAFQIYCDFAGYSELALGAAKVMGFSLPENFRQPFFAEKSSELWRRWHMTLMKWFTDYLYIPLGGSRKGRARKYINILIVFAISGLWHGASWTFVIWGLLSGLFMVLGELSAPLRSSLLSSIPVHNRFTGVLHRFFRTLITFSLFVFALVFFRAPSLKAAGEILGKIFFGFRLSDVFALSPFSLGLGKVNLFLLLFALLILFAADLINELRGDKISWLMEKKAPIRWGFYYTAVVMILFSTQIGAASFIYFRF
ncbi:MAG: MBOAT family protein [Lachnospiraceae bacterium]|nr:MBOAT family protein [Lachnospiraceae bacterium]